MFVNADSIKCDINNRGVSIAPLPCQPFSPCSTCGELHTLGSIPAGSYQLSALISLVVKLSTRVAVACGRSIRLKAPSIHIERVIHNDRMGTMAGRSAVAHANQKS